MAEFQMFTGVALDLGNAENRFPFIHNGKPVPPEQKATEANQNHPGSIGYLGQDPDVLLHKSSKWKKGDNTGSGGHFDPTGNIPKYTPDPSLTGPQSPPPPA